MSINKIISIHDAIYNTFEDTGLDLKTEIPTFTRWAVDAEKKIGSFYGWKKLQQVITGIECRAPLPKEAMRVQRVVFGDYGCDCGILMQNTGNWIMNNMDNGNFASIGSEALFLNVDISTSDPGFCALNGYPYQVQNNNLVFGQNIDKQKFTIQYLGFEVDCDGFLMVNENHIDAIVAYIKWKLAERSRYSPIKMDHSDVLYNKSEWKELRGQAMADDSELSPEEQYSIASMLHDPYSGWGLSVGMKSSNPYFINNIY